MTDAAEHVRVELLKREYVAGDIVHGDVFVHAFTAVEANGAHAYAALVAELVVVLVGVELMSWKEKHGSETRRRDFSKVFFSQKIALTAPAEFYELGGFYGYRFQYQLPSWLPGVISVKQTYASGRISVFKGAVRYTLEVRLDTSDGSASTPPANASSPSISQTKLRIHALPSSGPMRPLEASVSKELRSLLFFKKGRCEMNAAVSKNIHAAGAKLVVNASVHNDSSEAMESISLQLLQHIVLLNNGSDNSKMSFTKTVCERRFPGVAAGVHSVNQFALNLIDLATKSAIPPTSRTGHLFVVRYAIQLECQYAGNQSVKLDLPLRIVAAESGSA